MVRTVSGLTAASLPKVSACGATGRERVRTSSAAILLRARGYGERGDAGDGARSRRRPVR
jgi:hypothetical protein